MFPSIPIFKLFSSPSGSSFSFVLSLLIRNPFKILETAKGLRQ